MKLWALPTPALTDYRAPFDLSILRTLNAWPQPAGWISQGLGTRLVGATLIGLALGAILWRHRWSALWPLLTAGVAVGSTDWLGARVLKPLLHRLRPCYALPPGSVRVWTHVANSGALPSLHAANAFALAYVVARAVPRSWPWVYGLAALMAVGRVVAGVHWPSDVVAGALLGTCVGALATLTATRLRRRSLASV